MYILHALEYSQKKFQKSCSETSLVTIWTRNLYKRGEGSTFHGILKQSQDDKKRLIWNMEIFVNKKTPKTQPQTIANQFFHGKYEVVFSLIIKSTAAWSLVLFFFKQLILFLSLGDLEITVESRLILTFLMATILRHTIHLK